MIQYELPIPEIMFLMRHVLGLSQTLELPGYEECDEDTFTAAVNAIGRFSSEVLLPINADGDRIGSKLDRGEVKAPPGFSVAYKQFCEDGWNSLPFELEHGGQQLPFLLHAVLREGMAASNLSFALVHELNFGVYEALQAFGDDELKATYLPKLANGEWAGTMCLTEPHCGTDLGLIRTSAEPQGDGTYLLTGDKIFITWGDHDMSENIVHLVLARVKDARDGVKGLSLFLVPKYLPLADDDLGQRNDISVLGVEDKMGLHGSPTCAVNFDGAKAWRVGEEGKGLAAMFVMMNAARLSVGLQGLGVCEIAYQSAMAYAQDRLQGRLASGPAAPDQIADPIIVHPDVRRRLTLMKAELIAARGLCYWAAALLDEAHRSNDPEQRRLADQRVSFLTPVLKSYVSDLGSKFANEAVQMHGGHGFVKDHGVEQLVRDVRITQIYEGTNAIQAIDLATRKLKADSGAAFQYFLWQIREEAELADDAGLHSSADRLARVSSFLVEAEAEVSLYHASEFLDLTAITLNAMMMSRIERISGRCSEDISQALMEDIQGTNAVYKRHVLPRTIALEASIVGGSTSNEWGKVT